MDYMTTFLYCRRRVKPIAGAITQKTNIMNTSHPYHLVIGLDRSDQKAEVTNDPEANRFLHYEYRKGWEL